MSCGSAGRCRWRSAAAKAGKRSRAIQASSCHSGRSGRRAERAVHRAAHIAEREALGQRIDRLDQRQIRKALLVHHPVGMHHLQHTVVEFGGAGDVARLALGQELAQIVLARVEIGQRQRLPGVVAGDDAVGRARPVARRRPVLVDGDGDGDHLARLHRVELWPRAAIDDAGRQVKQQVDDARRLAVEQPGIELFQLRPDAGQAGERGEQGAEHERAHRAHAGLRVRRTQCWAVQSKR